MLFRSQESGAGFSDPNYFHVLHGTNKRGQNILPIEYEFLPADVLGVQMLKDKEKIAHNLGYHTPEMELQTYNGLGKIFPDTERNYHGYRMKKIYGVPVPEEGLDMRKNPLYGKRVLDIKKNVVDKDKYVDQLVDYYTKFYNDPESVYYTRGTDLEPVVVSSKKNLQDGGNLMPPMAGADQPVPMYAMGGSIPGAVGFTYARTEGSAPANGKYTKKTKASAQNGAEMKYYQEGLDFKPKTISQNGSRTPIVVSNPNDPRLRAYNDSLALYKSGIAAKQKYIDYVISAGMDESKISSSLPGYLYNNEKIQIGRAHV